MHCSQLNENIQNKIAVDLYHKNYDEFAERAKQCVTRSLERIFENDTSRIVVDIPEHTPLAHADPALVERAIANLLANALDHAPPNSTVRLEGGGAGDEVVLRIIDRGPGVPTDQLARIVEPFQRLGDTGHGTGVGLGLAVANGFVRAMGGRLAFEATPGGGLTVSVVLPTHRRASTSENGRHIP